MGIENGGRLRFAAVFEAGTKHFCSQHGYPAVTAAWLDAVTRRLPVTLRSQIGDALEGGLLEVPDGGSGFRLPSLPHKGPYAMFSRSSKQIPAPNWEYFVQLAEFARISRSAAWRGWSVGFEDGLMDVSVYEGKQLLWCIEVKEQATGLSTLVKRIGEHGAAIDWEKPDRGNDPLRKAKYLAMKRPQWFSAVAIGERHDFSVNYVGEGFELQRDVLPL